MTSLTELQHVILSVLVELGPVRSRLGLHAAVNGVIAVFGSDRQQGVLGVQPVWTFGETPRIERIETALEQLVEDGTVTLSPSGIQVSDDRISVAESWPFSQTTRSIVRSLFPSGVFLT